MIRAEKIYKTIEKINQLIGVPIQITKMRDGRWECTIWPSEHRHIHKKGDSFDVVDEVLRELEK